MRQKKDILIDPLAQRRHMTNNSVNYYNYQDSDRSFNKSTDLSIQLAPGSYPGPFSPIAATTNPHSPFFNLNHTINGTKHLQG